MRIPRLREFNVDVPAIEDKRKEINEASREMKMAESLVVRLESQREHAKSLDIVAGLDAKRNGKKDPGDKHADKLDRDLSAAKRERDILTALVRELEAEAATLLTEHATEIQAGLFEAAAKANTEQLAALAAVRRSRSQRMGLQQSLTGVGEYVEVPAPPEITGNGVDTTWIMTHGLYRPPNEEEITEVLAWLRAEAGDSTEAKQIEEMSTPTVDVFAASGGGLRPWSGKVQAAARREAEEVEVSADAG
jgi:hypothetical protein